MGPGSRIIIHLGTDGELVGLIRDWREVEPQYVSSAAVIDKADVLEKVESRLMRNTEKSVDVRIEESKLVLFDDGVGNLEPAIWVKAKRTDQLRMADTDELTTLEIPYDYYIPLLKSPHARFPDDDDASVLPLEDPKGGQMLR